MAGEHLGEKRSIGDLIKELRDESRVLLHQEIALAKTECKENAKTAARNAAVIGVGGAVAFAGFLILLLALTHGVALILDSAGLEAHSVWLAPLIVGLLVAAIGYGMIRKGINTFKNESFVPKQTVGTLKEDKAWLTSKVH